MLNYWLIWLIVLCSVCNTVAINEVHIGLFLLPLYSEYEPFRVIDARVLKSPNGLHQNTSVFDVLRGLSIETLHLNLTVSAESQQSTRETIGFLSQHEITQLSNQSYQLRFLHDSLGIGNVVSVDFFTHSDVFYDTVAFDISVDACGHVTIDGGQRGGKVSKDTALVPIYVEMHVAHVDECLSDTSNLQLQHLAMVIVFLVAMLCNYLLRLYMRVSTTLLVQTVRTRTLELSATELASKHAINDIGDDDLACDDEEQQDLIIATDEDEEGDVFIAEEQEILDWRTCEKDVFACPSSMSISFNLSVAIQSVSVVFMLIISVFIMTFNLYRADYYETSFSVVWYATFVSTFITVLLFIRWGAWIQNRKHLTVLYVINFVIPVFLSYGFLYYLSSTMNYCLNGKAKQEFVIYALIHLCISLVPYLWSRKHAKIRCLTEDTRFVQSTDEHKLSDKYTLSRVVYLLAYFILMGVSSGVCFMGIALFLFNSVVYLLEHDNAVLPGIWLMVVFFSWLSLNCTSIQFFVFTLLRRCVVSWKRVVYIHAFWQGFYSFVLCMVVLSQRNVSNSSKVVFYIISVFIANAVQNIHISVGMHRTYRFLTRMYSGSKVD